MSIIRLKVNEYTHVLDQNSGEVYLIEGPGTFTLAENQQSLFSAPQQYFVVPSNSYCKITNPVLRDSTTNEILFVENASYSFKIPKYQFGISEYRFFQTPFPLYPMEVAGPIEELTLLKQNEALLLEVKSDSERTVNGKLQFLRAGDQYLFYGPGLYYPCILEEAIQKVEPIFLEKNQAVRLRAKKSFKDQSGVERVAGERWQLNAEGYFFLDPNVELEEIVSSTLVTVSSALTLRAISPFFDEYASVERKKDDQWLVTSKGESYLPRPYEVIESVQELMVLGKNQYCVILNPYSDGKYNFGAMELRRGPLSFFLHPSEILRDGCIKEVFVLRETEALLVEALTSFDEVVDENTGNAIHRCASSRWIVKGPCGYVPPIEVRIIEKREVISLSANEGVYIRNRRTGKIISVFGKSLLLNEDEEIWEKPVSEFIRDLLTAPRLSLWCTNSRVPKNSNDTTGGDSTASPGETDRAGPSLSSRDVSVPSRWAKREVPSAIAEKVTPYKKDRVISANVPHNALVRLYDYSKGTSRVEAGPACVHLEPNEEFIPLSLSGGRPKKPNQIHSLFMFLGPDFMGDVIEVETLDHARLQLELAYNWEFDTSDIEKVKRIAFTLPDFIGEACKTLASRIRELIAGETFENFHRNSSSLIRQAVFTGEKNDGLTELHGESLYFPVNGLLITNVDIQSVEPVDANTLVALTKSVQLAVEIITKFQENEAAQQAALIEQEAKDRLELQVIHDRASAEKERVELFRIIAENTAIEQSGSSRAQAVAESDARSVESEAFLTVAPLQCEADKLGFNEEIRILNERMKSDLSHDKSLAQLHLEHLRSLAEVEAKKYEDIMQAIGQATVVAIARSAPELKEKLLKSLGLTGFLLTDGKSPVNLFGVADQLSKTGKWNPGLN